MKVENCTFRVNKHSAATEVFITSPQGVNTVLYLPPDADVAPTKPLEFLPAPLVDVEEERRASNSQEG